MRFIGDVHGKFSRYEKIISECEESIQVGDMGVGFARMRKDEPSFEGISGNHRFIRGNHDNPDACRSNPRWIKDGHFEDGILFVGGAWSIDQAYRTEGLDWWADEELSIAELQKIIDFAEKVRPKIVVSHDFPSFAIAHLFYKEPIKTRTQQALGTIWNLTKPELWIAGHWHTDADMVIEGTRFICLNELSYIDVPLSAENAADFEAKIKRD